MITVIPEKDKNGEVKGMFGITQDVTDQQRAEESLKRALSTNNSILQEAALTENDFIVLLDFEKGTAELRYGSWFIKGIEGTPVERRLQIADLSSMVKSFLSKKEESERFSKMLDPVLLEKELFKEGKRPLFLISQCKNLKTALSARCSVLRLLTAKEERLS